jgi:hypothetical protein
MSNSGYYVVGTNDMWMVQIRNSEAGQHNSRNEATTLAITAAHTLAMRGELAHVCVLDDDGRLQRKWSYNPSRSASALQPCCFRQSD